MPYSKGIKIKPHMYKIQRHHNSRSHNILVSIAIFPLTIGLYPSIAQLPHLNQFTNIPIDYVCIYRNNNNNNNTTINANTKLVQHSTQRTIMPMNNMCVQPTVIGQKVGTSKNTSASKYLAQTNPSISNIGQTSCISTTQYRSAETLQGDQRITTYRTIQPTESRPSSLPKSVTVVTHPSSVNSEKLNQSSARKETEWNHV